MGIPDFCQMELELPALSGPCYQKNNEGKTENSYYQQEYYLSASVLYRLLNNLSFSLSTDGSINTMNANMADFAHPTRYSWLTAIAGKYVNEWFTLSASALATVINEQADKGRKRRQSPQINSLRQRHIQAFPE